MGKGQLIFVRTPLGCSVVTENPRGGERGKPWKDSEGGTTQICLENEGMVEGSRKSSKVITGDRFTEETFKARIG